MSTDEIFNYDSHPKHEFKGNGDEIKINVYFNILKMIFF